MSIFEDILSDLGSFGPYQVIIFILVSCFETPAAWVMFLPVFTGAKLQWACPVEADQNNNRTDWYNVNGTVQNWSMNTCTPDNKVCEGIQYNQEFTSLMSEWNLICDQAFVSELITTIQMIGVLVGACITGQLADTFGRKRVLYVEYTLMLAVWFSSSFVTSWHLYAVLRFIIGALFAGVMIVNFVLPIEFVGPQWRTFCGCIGFWAVGVMTLSLWAYLIRDWRILCIATSVSSVGILLSWWVVPESARWLVQKGRFEEAYTILKRVAKFNKKTAPDITMLQAAVEEEQNRLKENKKYSYWHLFKTVQMAKNTCTSLYIWFVCGSVYYGISFNVKNLSGDRYINNFLSGLVEIPALILVVAINNKVGRKKTLFALLMLAGLSSFSIFIISFSSELKEQVVLTQVLAMLGKSGISGGWAAAQVFSAEMFPTVVRNLGYGACSMSARIGLILAPQFVYLHQYTESLPYVVFGVLGITSAISCLFLPETTGKALPEVIQHKQQHSECPARDSPSHNDQLHEDVNPQHDVSLDEFHSMQAILQKNSTV